MNLLDEQKPNPITSELLNNLNNMINLSPEGTVRINNSIALITIINEA